MRKLNIVLFSSGISENNGILPAIKTELEERGYCCSYWRDLFTNAHDSQNIALLPMLLKKIPTFDFAVLICEGHDKALIRRETGAEEVAVMRDNVLFEIGLCAMALGLSRTVLVTDSKVRLPDDLTGVGNQIALKHIIYDSGDSRNYGAAADETGDYIDSIRISADEIDLFIREHHATLSPVSIGAAATTACGYAGNFVLRTLEHICDGVVLSGSQETSPALFSPEKVFMHIILPQTYDDSTARRAKAASDKLSCGFVPSARNRRAEFRYKLRNDELHIYDYPTTIVTSYHTAMMILELEADDYADPQAKERFSAKELDLFEASLRALLSHSFIDQTVRHCYPENEQKAMTEQLDYLIENNVFIERTNY